MTDILLLWGPSLPFSTWLITAVLCRIAKWHGRDPGVLRTVRNELHPFRWGLAIAIFISATVRNGPDIDPGIMLALDLYWCWTYRNDNDDDRWKRRLDAITGRVAEVAGRLVVAPATS
jgi:hypothetical protein